MTENALKYSCADFTFPLLPHRKVLRLIQMLGFGAVDLGLFEGRSHLYPGEVTKNVESTGRDLKEDLESIGLEVSDVFLQTGPEPPVAAANTPDNSVKTANRELFLKMIKFTQILGCRHLTGLPGVPHKGQSREDDWQRAVEEAHWRYEKAGEAGIVYSIEPHVGSILPDAATTLNFINSCPGITLTLDYGHFIYQGQTNESVHALIPYASHVHARGGAKGKLQTTVKENEIDFQTIVSELMAASYDGYICMEYVYQDWEGCNRTDNVSETILLSEQLKNISTRS